MSDEPLTKRDLEQLFTEMKNFVLERETALTWKVVILLIGFIGVVYGAQFGLIYFILTHAKT